MNIRFLLLMRRWVERPPSATRMKLLAAVVTIGFAIYGLEYYGYWPDWATSEKARIKPKTF